MSIQREIDMEVLVLVKAYPTPSQKYSESVCVAGLRIDTPSPTWVRLYPVCYRDLPHSQQFKKYAVIRLQAIQRREDSRPESFTPIVETITEIDYLDATESWKKRIPYIERVKVASMCELYRLQQTVGTSLGAFRPAEITGCEITPTSSTWDCARQAALGQGSLFCQEQQRRPLEKIPFDLHYVFSCDDPACGGHRMSFIDWELGEHYRNTAGRSEEERLELVRERWLDHVCAPNRDTHFFAGSIARRPQQFVLLGAFWPPVVETPRAQELSLF
jgi:hypothetical protein